MWMQRTIMHVELEQARYPSEIVKSVVGEMLKTFHPATVDTRISNHSTLNATVIQMSLPGTCSPWEPDKRD